MELEHELHTSQKSPWLLANRLLWIITVFLFPFLPQLPQTNSKRKKNRHWNTSVFLAEKTQLTVIPSQVRKMLLVIFVNLFVYRQLKKNTAIIQMSKSSFKNIVFWDSWLNWEYRKNWNVVVKCKLALETNSHTCVFQVLWELIHGASWMLFRSDFS